MLHQFYRFSLMDEVTCVYKDMIYLLIQKMQLMVVARMNGFVQVLE